MEKIPVHAVGFGFRDRDINAVCGRIIDHFIARGQLPLIHLPGGNDLYGGVERPECELEPHLVIPFAGCPVCNSLGTFCTCYLDDLLCDQGSRKRCP